LKKLASLAAATILAPSPVGATPLPCPEQAALPDENQRVPELTAALNRAKADVAVCASASDTA
jgi:hypothetical protein